MPAKMRPPVLSVVVPEQQSNGVTVTDTMTLVVRDAEGGEMRVKDSLRGLPTKKAAESSSVAASKPDESRSVLNSDLEFEKLRIGMVVGQGSGGKVRVVQHRDTKVSYALKYVDFEGRSEEARNMVANELKRVGALGHENIVSSYEAFFRKSRLCVLLEWMDAGTLANISAAHEKDGFPEDILAYVARSLFKGLAHLHSNRTMHRDIKPANVLANSKGDVKISDFGIAKVFTADNCSTMSTMGSAPYMSPEMILSQPYSLPTDIWSAGMTIAECAIGAYPLGVKKSADPFEMYEKMQKGVGAVDWGIKGRTHSEVLVSFISSCLVPQETRPTAQALLAHPFIKLADSVTPERAGAWFMEGRQRASDAASDDKDGGKGE